MGKFISAVCARGPLISRVVAALFGGYFLAALVAVAAIALPLEQGEAVIAGMLASFLMYAASTIWVFAAGSATRAWAGLMVCGLPFGVVAWLVTRTAGA